MTRATSRVTRKARHKKIISQAKGYRGQRSNSYRVAKQAVVKASQYSYRDRKNKKREFRKLWIVRLNAASRLYGLPYNKLIHGLKLANIELDRKQLSELAISDASAFEEVITKVKSFLDQ